MSSQDFLVAKSPSKFAPTPSTYNVAAASTTINIGEPVVRALGAGVVTQAVTASPVVGTNFMVGFATSKSTQTATVAGTVQVSPLEVGAVYIGTPTAAITTQAAYDLLVGRRVTWALTAGAFTVNSTDGATNGLVIMPLDYTNTPSNVGKIAFAVRAAVDALA